MRSRLSSSRSPNILTSVSLGKRCLILQVEGVALALASTFIHHAVGMLNFSRLSLHYDAQVALLASHISVSLPHHRFVHYRHRIFCVVRFIFENICMEGEKVFEEALRFAVIII